VTAHDWFIEHRMDYATGTLERDEAATFEAHLDKCEECRREVSQIEQDLRWLPMGLPPAVPHPGLKRRIAQDVFGERAPSFRRWLLPSALAASVLLALGGWWAGQRKLALLETEMTALRIRSAALADTLSVMRGAARVLQASLQVGDQRGGLVIFADESTHRWNVVVHGLPPAPPGTRYQFWFICADGMVRGSAIPGGGSLPTMFTTGMPPNGGAVLGAALTMEPMDADSGPPRGKTLVHLML
jgi:anti-sigma-K factor RskA